VVVAGEQIVLAFPAKYLVQFMANHHMLQLTGRPEWRVVRGGSRRYVEAMVAHWDVQVRLSSPVRGIARDADGVQRACDAGSERFDQVVLACHSDQALALLADASDAERDILGAIRYQPTTPCCIPMRACCRATARHGRRGTRTCRRIRRRPAP
jgi:predicted NAD/FAD-binding protein